MFNYSKREKLIKPSAIRELAKLIQDPDIISFAGGMPAPELFPLEEMAMVSSDIIRKNGGKALQYSATEGLLDLRKIIANRMNRFNVSCTEENIIITNGSQQGLAFSGKLFIDEGDVIICENPSYIGALNAFRIFNPRIIGVSMDENGMLMDELAKTLKEYPQAKFIYTIPDFQNPTGVTLSAERKQTMIKLSEQYQVPIIEDNPYLELNFNDGISYPIKSYDKTGNVIYLGSFSKTLCPGLRVGWILAPQEVVKKYALIKQSVDLHTNTLSQMEIVEYVSRYNYDHHIMAIRDLYRARRDTMLKTMAAEFPDSIHWTKPQGGMFIWVTLSETMNATDVFNKALEQKVAFVPGDSFFPDGNISNCFRLNYVTMDENRIIEGIKRLGQVLKGDEVRNNV
jgi:2-aminoadipate transaminase